MDIAPPVALLPILLASILGSAHCAGMCGGFVAWYSHGIERHAMPHLLYSLGRLLTYLTLGISAAWIGRSIDGASSISRLSALIVGVTLIFAGIYKLLGVQLPVSNKLVALFGSSLGRCIKKLTVVPNRLRPFAIGVITTLLPCGWLYGFVGLALASADTVQASLIMFVFWMGTLPTMLALGFISRYLTQLLGKYLPRTIGVLLILSGLLSLSLHVQHSDPSHQCHSHNDAS